MQPPTKTRKFPYVFFQLVATTIQRQALSEVQPHRLVLPVFVLYINEVTHRYSVASGCIIVYSYSGTLLNDKKK